MQDFKIDTNAESCVELRIKFYKSIGYKILHAVEEKVAVSCVLLVTTLSFSLFLYIFFSYNFDIEDLVGEGIQKGSLKKLIYKNLFILGFPFPFL